MFLGDCQGYSARSILSTVQAAFTMMPTCMGTLHEVGSQTHRASLPSETYPPTRIAALLSNRCVLSGCDQVLDDGRR